MSSSRTYLVLASVVFGLSGASSLQSQTISARSAILVSGDSVDALRLSGAREADGLLLRSTSSLMDDRRRLSATSFGLVLPYVRVVTNSRLPFGQNDGALWAGKGTNVRALAGFTASAGPVRLIVIPEITHSSNGELSIDPTDPAFAPPLPASRSVFSSPFNVHPYSLDMPWRMGDAAFTEIHAGQSSLTLSANVVEVGAATENELWGPALRNPLVMSDNAPGFPHLFLRTRGPVTTPLGRFDARWIVGGLEESDWFDNDESNDVRSLSAIALTWKASRSSPFTFGFTRAVFAPSEDYGDAATKWFDAFRNTGHPNARTVGDSTMIPGPDQIFSLFAHASLPRYGLDSYIEWARADFPVSLRDFIEEPIHSRGYVVGTQWVTPVGRESRIRLQGEVASVEQSSTYRFRQQGSFYTSRAVIQGYTNRGQLIGSGMGPGSSGAWLAADFMRDGFQAGVTWSRVRFNNDAFFLQSYASRCGHDVTVAPGVRASFATKYFRIGADLSFANRYNTFFQNKTSCEDGGQGSDRSNTNFSITFASLGW